MTKRVRERSPGPKTEPATIGLDDTQSYDSDGDGAPHPATTSAKTWLDLAMDPATSDVARQEHIEQCMALLEPTGKGGALALGEPHWQLFGAITLVHRPAAAARRFAEKFLPMPDAPMTSDECVRRARAVGALRTALASIEQHATTHALRAVVGKVLYVAGSSKPSLILSRELLGLAFLGRGPLVRAVFEACIGCIERQGAWSKLTCLASLAVLIHLGGGSENDLDRAALALEDADEGLPPSYETLQFCGTLLQALSASRTDDAWALEMLLEDIGQTLAWFRSADLTKESVELVARWAGEVMDRIDATL
jgi:hypothetical protein